MIYENPIDTNIWMQISVDKNYIFGSKSNLIDGKIEDEKIFYNWRTGEVVNNDLTQAMNLEKINVNLDPYRNFHTGKRFLFGDSGTLQQKVKITWNKEYSNMEIAPLSYLLPQGGRGFGEFIISPDGVWASTLVFYRGLRNELLCKRAFFHLENRYPNGISIPIITDDYEEYRLDYGTFVKCSR
jgi:hypothetical protein